MPAYRHYRLEGSGRINKAEWFEASDDADAIRRVRELNLAVASEVWNGNRRVATIEPPTDD